MSQVANTTYNLRSNRFASLSDSMPITTEPSNQTDVEACLNNEEPSIKDVMLVLKSMHCKLDKLDTIAKDVKDVKEDLATTNTNVSNLDGRVKTLEKAKKLQC